MLSTQSEIRDRVIEMIARSKSIPADTITPDATLDSLQIDSLDKINLTFDIEELYKISIPDESLNKLHTVADVITGVQTLIAAKPPSEA